MLEIFFSTLKLIGQLILIHIEVSSGPTMRIRGMISVSDLYRKRGVSDDSIYKWKAKFGSMDVL
jgi:hypothetical protein